jgi:uncharacterized repeat protein (TIGR03803 family)
MKRPVPLYALLLWILTSPGIGAAAQTEVVLHQFSGGPDGAWVLSGLVSDQQHKLYGTAMSGGGSNCLDAFGRCGVVFEVTPPDPTAHVPESLGIERVIYSFKEGSDGAQPGSGVILDRYGNLYGTTASGGGSSQCPAGCGTAYMLERAASGWKERVLYRFSGGADGAIPNGPLAWGKDGTFYGTTIYGGNLTCLRSGGACGTVFALKRSGTGLREVVIHQFNQQDGAFPYAGVVFDAAGNLYGTTTSGGNGNGTIFELTPTASGWKETTLFNFIGGSGEGVPMGGVVLDSSGNLFGTTEFGGDFGSGTVFELSQTAGVWQLTTLHSFNAYDGQYPRAGVVIDSHGNLYGTAWGGGTGYSCTDWCGVVYKLQHGTWEETLLYNFQDGPDGAFPAAPPLLDGKGNLYGTAAVGGDLSCSIGIEAGCGVVFRLAGVAASD